MCIECTGVCVCVGGGLLPLLRCGSCCLERRPSRRRHRSAAATDQAALPARPRAPLPQRHNPRSDLFPMHKFDHIEFWCGDATTTSGRWAARWRRACYGPGTRAGRTLAALLRSMLLTLPSRRCRLMAGHAAALAPALHPLAACLYDTAPQVWVWAGHDAGCQERPVLRQPPLCFVRHAVGCASLSMLLLCCSLPPPLLLLLAAVLLMPFCCCRSSARLAAGCRAFCPARNPARALPAVPPDMLASVPLPSDAPGLTAPAPPSLLPPSSFPPMGRRPGHGFHRPLLHQNRQEREQPTCGVSRAPCHRAAPAPAAAPARDAAAVRRSTCLPACLVLLLCGGRCFARAAPIALTRFQNCCCLFFFTNKHPSPPPLAGTTRRRRTTS